MQSRLKYSLSFFAGDVIRFVEVAVAVALVFVLSVALFHGLTSLFGPADRYGFNDPEIYRWSNEEDFVDFLRSVDPISSAEISEQLAIYRYHHSWRSIADSVIRLTWVAVSVGVPTIAVIPAFRQYRMLRLRERAEDWVYRRVNG
jgi:hypothetical protein